MNLKLKNLALFMAASVSMAGCGKSEDGGDDLSTKNRMSEAEIAAGILTPEVMWKMGRIGESALSPDGSTVAYTTTWYDMAENRGVTSLYLVPSAGGDESKLTGDDFSVSSPSWSADGKSIYVMRDGQVWSVEAEGGRMVQVSDIEGGIEGYGIAPDGGRMFYIQKVAVAKMESKDIYPDMDKSKVLVYDDLMVRHWNYWDRGSYLHIFITDITDGKASAGYDIMPGEAWDAPMAPYFDNGEISWSNASTRLAYTCKKMTGTKYAQSTDSDVYVYDIATKQTTNINKAGMPTDPRLRIAPMMPGYDRYPRFSPDDRYIAFQSMAEGGNESDKDRLMVWDSTDGSMREVSEGFDYSASNIIWTDSDNILFRSAMNGTYQICEAKLSAPGVKVLTQGDHDIIQLSAAGGVRVVQVTSLQQAPELFLNEGGALKQITFVNKHIYDNVRMGQVQKRWIPTTDGKEMLTWVVLPPDFDPAKKYPTLLYCEGGPQSVISQMWSYRWNFQLIAAQGYVVVAPNRRGTPSFGTEWLHQISGDYSGQNIRDYLSAIDALSTQSWVDKDRLGAVGASYGGYSTYYLAGVHEKRFKAFISHCGIFDFESMYGETEELFFLNHEYGGPYWDKDNATAQRSYANSPHTLVRNWDTPIMIITGFDDFRIPYTQSLEAFTAARVRGVPARLVAFENEGHQVFQPQNSMVWNREFFGWLDKYLKTK